MTILELLGLALLVAAVLLVVVVAVRRVTLTRSGGVDVAWRTDLRNVGAHWILGQARYSGDDLQLFRSFSPLLGASRTIRRGTLILGERRLPIGAEPDLLPPGSVIVRCKDAGQDLELSLGDGAATGLQAWLESAPSAPQGRPISGGT